MLYKFINNTKNGKNRPDNWYFVVLYLILCGAICCIDSCTPKRNKQTRGDGNSINNGRKAIEKKSLVRADNGQMVDNGRVGGYNVAPGANNIDSDSLRGEMSTSNIMGKTISVTSEAFEEGGSIPSRYTCDRSHGAADSLVDVSPPLGWDGAPAGTQSIAVICQDPDAPMGLWVHWVLFNLPPETVRLPEKVVIKESQDAKNRGAVQGVEGVNSWGKNGYGGPCPPDREHRYFFTVYMLNKKLTLDKTATREQLLAVINADGGRDIVAQGQLMGRYEKKHR